MNRVLAIGVKAGKLESLYAGNSEKDAFDAAAEATGFDSVEVYINPVPFSVLNCKKTKPKPKAKAKK